MADPQTPEEFWDDIIHVDERGWIEISILPLLDRGLSKQDLVKIWEAMPSPKNQSMDLEKAESGQTAQTIDIETEPNTTVSTTVSVRTYHPNYARTLGEFIENKLHSAITAPNTSLKTPKSAGTAKQAVNILKAKINQGLKQWAGIVYVSDITGEDSEGKSYSVMALDVKKLKEQFNTSDQRIRAIIYEAQGNEDLAGTTGNGMAPDKVYFKLSGCDQVIRSIMNYTDIADQSTIDKHTADVTAALTLSANSAYPSSPTLTNTAKSTIKNTIESNKERHNHSGYALGTLPDTNFLCGCFY